MQRERNLPIDDVIDELIDTCNGDVYAALKALLLVNEFLETELQSLNELATNLAPDLQPDGGTLQ